ncbi:MAG TPA: SUMF1/EgtB/PvdO family nonheme iron enzyme, partial [Candidatus Hydrogenedentes bacterium]|nr:SUMF1/EgtB/PvdO family nonheme iron enzyme [Candidatus Hydrogenedentota bacterium]
KAAPYYVGDVVTLTATPASGWRFVGWSGAIGGTTNPISVTLGQTTTVVATFEQNQYSLTVNIVGQGTVQKSIEPPYAPNTSVTLTPVPSSGWTFDHWSGALTGTANPATLVVTGNTDVTATFIPADPSLVYVPAGWFEMGAPGNAPAPPSSAALDLMLQLNAQGYGGGDKNGTNSGAYPSYGQPSTKGNGVLDLAEVGMLDYILSHSDAPHYATAVAAWNRNFTNIQTLAATPSWPGKSYMDAWGTGSSGGIFFPYMTVSCMAAYATIGDSRDFVTYWLGAYDVGFNMSLIPSAKYDFATRTVNGLPYNLTMSSVLGIHADADGDGFTNQAEWNGLIGDTAFQDLIWSTKEAAVMAYAKVALDPSKVGSQISLDGQLNGYPRHFVQLSPYRIGKFEVTTGEYVQMLNRALSQGKLCKKDGTVYNGGDVFFKDATAETKSLVQLSDSDCQVSYSSGQFVVKSRNGMSMANHPMVEVSWYGAVAYCNWLSEAKGLTPCYNLSTWQRVQPAGNGYRLPTEAEWERAAAWDTRYAESSTLPDGSRGKHWVYGTSSDVLDFSRSNYNDFYGGQYCNPVGLTTKPYTSPVGYFNGRPGTVDSKSPVGCYDMSGNVWEWCQDWKGDYSSDSQVDPQGAVSGGFFVLRGGGWSFIAGHCRTDYRGWEIPAHTGFNEGFRIAQSVQ